MLLFICYTLLKKFGTKTTLFKYLKNQNFAKIFDYKLRISLCIILFPFFTEAQNSKLNYKILRNGNNIGWLKLEKSTEGNTSNLLLTSEVKTKIIFPIKISAKETSTFENGKLIHSLQLRKTNGTTKLNKETKYINEAYEVSEGGEKQRLSIENIETNLLSLFFKEPSNLKSVYSDKLQRFIKIAKTDDGGYKISFEKGSSNCYYYKDGICVKVKIEHSFYTAEIVMNY
ncbi:DUF6134 family protein [Flavobacterium sp. H122]|uniref:DUF6134 family protein n=1 Tax=Flavobacterium sp. H122 TaxID=2529860 RepID=UPI0010AAB48E|nr:DUF6134 family protein [Flavobacterium sp. H122]